MDSSARRLLVTGGAGFIGSNFVHHWRAAHPADRIVVLDALTYAGNVHNLASLARDAQFRFVHGDICDGARVEALLREERVDTLVNFAAESHVDRSIAAPDAFVRTNIQGTHALLTAARAVWLSATPRTHRFHHVSTDEVYGSLGPDDAPRNENAAYAPSSPYSASKAAADHLVCAWHRTYGLEVTVSRSCNNYGARQFPEKLVPLVITNLLRGAPVPVYGDGLNVRDWIDVRDHCRGVELVITRGRSGESYNLAAGAATQNLALVERLCDLVDSAFARDSALVVRFPDAAAARGLVSRSCLRYVADRPGHDRRYALDTARADALGFTPSHDLAAGLAATLAWYLANEAWWRTVLAGRHHEPDVS